MKRKMSVSIVVGLILTGIAQVRAQDLVPKEEAIRTVKGKILKEDTLNIWLYITPEPIKKDSVIRGACGPPFDYAYTNPYLECWFFFIDDDPPSKFAHPCRYLFFYQLYEDWQYYTLIYEMFFPSIRDSMEQIIPSQGVGDNPQESLSPQLHIYPSHFSDEMTILFELPEKSSISLEIQDIAGRLVKQLVKDIKTPEKHYVYWNGKDEEGRKVSNGIYFLRLDTESLSLTKKVVMMR